MIANKTNPVLDNIVIMNLDNVAIMNLADNDERKQDQTTTTVKLSKKEKKVLSTAKNKEINLNRIIEANKSLFHYNANDAILTTPPEVKPFIEISATDFALDMYVAVQSDFGVGKHRPAGCGYIKKLYTEGAIQYADIKYTPAHDGGRLHKKIPTIKLIVANLHQDMMLKPEKRKRESDEENAEFEIEVDLRSTTEILLELLSENNRRKSGWHRRDLKLNPKMEEKRKAIVQLNRAEKTQLYVESEMIRTYKSLTGSGRHEKRGKKSRKFIKRNAKHDYHSLTYLLESAWGIRSGCKYLQRLKAELVSDAMSNGVDPLTANVSVSFREEEESSDVSTVIDNYRLAETFFTAKYLFVSNKMKEQAADLDTIDRKTYLARQSDTRSEFDKLSKETKEIWEQRRKAHLRKWSTIKDTLMRELRKNNSICYKRLASKIDYWCSDSTIRKWVQSRQGYNLYMERVIPLLNDEQKRKHLECAKRIRTNWGLGEGKYLWIHYDEKWFWGLVLRKNAKSFWDLDPNTIKAYHKSHISKVMGICTLGFAFVDNVENGGTGIKIDLSRCQSNKVAGRKQRAARRDQETGRIVYDGEILRQKGDLYLVDCNVTGSTCGTSDDPKFALLSYFHELVFEAVKDLVKVGGKFEGYLPVFQGDNAGPHQDAKYKKGVEEYCEREGWKWISQGPQMPHVNVYDLSVFPNMSKRHTQLSRDHHGTHVLKEDQIWKAAEEVFKELPSCKIASGFIQAYRLAERIIQHRGDNTFLSGSSGGIRTGVSKDFQQTKTGLVRKDGRVIFAPPLTM